MSKQVNALKKRRDQLSARIQKLEASQKARQKKQDTRRKILIGAYMIDKAKKEQNLDELYQAVLQYLTRDIDKKLFQSTTEE